MTDLKKTARQLAAKGRYGDTMLLHVNPLEVAGLASLLPNGRLPINPATGLPEAFFFLPFLSSLFGAAAPAAAAATAAAPAVAAGAGAAGAAAGTAAAGLGAATGIGSAGTLASGIGALGKGIASIPGAVAKGIGKMFGAGGAGAGAAGVVDPMVTGSIGTAAPVTQTLGHTYTSGAPAMMGRASLLGNVPAYDPMATASLSGRAATTPGLTTTVTKPLAAEIAATPQTPSAVAEVAKRTAQPVVKTATADPWAGVRKVTTTQTATPAPETGKGGLGGLLKMENMMPFISARRC